MGREPTKFMCCCKENIEIWVSWSREGFCFFVFFVFLLEKNALFGKNRGEQDQPGVGISCRQIHIHILVVRWTRWSSLTWEGPAHTEDVALAKGCVAWASQWFPSLCERHYTKMQVVLSCLQLGGEKMGPRKTNATSYTKTEDAHPAAGWLLLVTSPFLLWEPEISKPFYCWGLSVQQNKLSIKRRAAFLTATVEMSLGNVAWGSEYSGSFS